MIITSTLVTLPKTQKAHKVVPASKSQKRDKKFTFRSLLNGAQWSLLHKNAKCTKGERITHFKKTTT
jgi:hypothetical protein